MSQVFRELTFTHRGELISFTPSMKMLRDMASFCYDPINLILKMGNETLTTLELASAIFVVLKHCGKKYTEEDCYAYVVNHFEGREEELSSFSNALIKSISPDLDLGKKP
jgi:hypothetical protein